MRTTVSEDDELDLSGLDELEQEYNGEAAVLQARIDGLEAENAELIRQIASATVEEAAVLRQTYNNNKNEISRIETELSAVRRKQAELAQAKEEAAADNDVPTDELLPYSGYHAGLQGRLRADMERRRLVVGLYLPA